MEQASYNQVAEYYDELWAQLEKESLAGINSRHRAILYRLKKHGLRTNSKLLEIGCGIGTLSSFIAGAVRNGKITAVDISPSSIEFAKKKYKHKTNLEFLVSDMTNFSYPGKFDIILFPDVLEHIPVEAHQNIFNTIKSFSHSSTLVMINLPNPRCIRWFRKNKPEALQIIDQDIESDTIINKLYSCGYFLETKDTYALYFDKPDYEWFVFRMNGEFDHVKQISKTKLIWNNILLRMLNLF